MNEWEWQLLEEKTPLDHLEISGSRSAEPEAGCACVPARAAM